jgi:hypothetical protein
MAQQFVLGHLLKKLFAVLVRRIMCPRLKTSGILVARQALHEDITSAIGTDEFRGELSAQ